MVPENLSLPVSLRHLAPPGVKWLGGFQGCCAVFSIARAPATAAQVARCLELNLSRGGMDRFRRRLNDLVDAGLLTANPNHDNTREKVYACPKRDVCMEKWLRAQFLAAQEQLRGRLAVTEHRLNIITRKLRVLEKIILPEGVSNG